MVVVSLTVLIGSARSSCAADKGPVVIRETSLDDSLQESVRRTMEENRRLKIEKENMKNELDKYIGRANVFAERVKLLADQADVLTRQLSEARDKTQEEKQALEQKIQELNDEKKRLEELIAALKEKRHEDEYYILWMTTEEGLRSADAKLRQISAEREQLRRENGKLHYNLGNLLFKKGDYAAAVYEYQFALKYLPDDPDIFYNLGVIYDYHLRDPQKASMYYGQYIKRQPDSQEASRLKERIADSDMQVRMQEEPVTNSF